MTSGLEALLGDIGARDAHLPLAARARVQRPAGRIAPGALRPRAGRPTAFHARPRLGGLAEYRFNVLVSDPFWLARLTAIACGRGELRATVAKVAEDAETLAIKRRVLRTESCSLTVVVFVRPGA